MRKKGLCLTALLMALLILLTACGSDSIIGTWKLTGVSGGDEAGMAAVFLMGASVTVSFDSSGNCTTVMSFLGQSQSETQSYSVDGNKITIDGDAGEFTINGKVMTMTHDGTTMTFERK